MTDVFDSFRREIDDLVDAGEWVVSFGHWIGRGRTSGAEVKGRAATAFRFRDGKVVEHIVGFSTKDAALQAARLRE